LVLLVKEEDTFTEGGIPILAMVKDTSLLPGLIFAASIGLPTLNKGREIGSKIGGIIALHNGLMFDASYVKSSTTQPLNVLNFKAIASSLVQI